MPLIVIKKTGTILSGTGGGSGSTEQYLKCELTNVELTDYLLPVNVLITKIICSSGVNRFCAVRGRKIDGSFVEIIPDTNYAVNQIETFGPVAFYKDQLRIYPSDFASWINGNPLSVIIFYQTFNF